MNASETGAAKRMLHQIGRQLSEGRDPDLVLAGCHRYCDKLELADKLLSALLLAWLDAGHKRGRDLAQMAADAELLTHLFTEGAQP